MEVELLIEGQVIGIFYGDIPILQLPLSLQRCFICIMDEFKVVFVASTA